MCRRILAVVLSVLLISTPAFALELTGELEYVFIHDLVDFISENAKFPEDKDVLLDAAFRERLTNPDSGFNGMVSAVMKCLDEHSGYMPEETFNSFYDDAVVGSFTGIGVSMYESEDGLVVSAAIAGSPAEKAGILGGDILIAVDDEDITGQAFDDVKAKIVGEVGTTVKITVRRGAETLSFTVVRDVIGTDPVTYETIDGVGYIRFDSFNPQVVEEVGEAVAFFEKEGVEKLILDIRDNSGGEMNAALDICRMFTPKGVIMRVEYADSKNNRLHYNEEDNKGKFKLALLVNENSASASEFFAGAVQDTGSGTIIGTKTFGKGTVQTLMRIVSGGGIRLTIAEYKTAGGRALHHVGVMPDIYVENTWTPRDISQMLPLQFEKEWKAGESGEGVLAVEQRLAFWGYIDEADDMLDAETEAAIRIFQAQNQLPITGTADVYTQICLDAADYTAPMENDDQLARALEYLNEAA